MAPGAKSTPIEGPYGENALRLRVAAPPTGGKANAEAARFLAELLGTSPSDVHLVHRTTSWDKVVLVRGREHLKTLSSYLQ
jgi:uncharacterized protein